MRGLQGAALAAAMSAALAGCQTFAKYSFAPGPQQQVVTRQGREAVVSSRAGSTVTLMPMARKSGTMARPRMVAIIENRSRGAVTVHYAEIGVWDAATDRPIKVYSVDDLQSEAQGEALAGAILMAGAGVAAGAVAANNVGTTTTYGTVRSPYGTSNYVWRTYNPAAAQAAQAAGAAAGAAGAAAAFAEGDRKVQELESIMLMDQTLQPGEAYGGAIEFNLATDNGSGKQYVVRIPVGEDTHEFRITATSVGAS